MKLKKIGLFVAGTLVALTLMAGSCDEKGLGDAPVGEAYEAPRSVIVMPDGFANLVVVCDATTRIYVTTREAPPVVVPDHPECQDDEGIDEQGEVVPFDGEGE